MMTYSIVENRESVQRIAISYVSLAMRLSIFLFILSIAAIFAQSHNDIERDSSQPLIIDNVADCDIFGIGRSVVVRGSIKNGVIAFGGDVIVEGRVEGDVAAIGGSIKQSNHSYIGGDVIVVGGTYQNGSTAGRDPLKTTVMFTGYEQELRELARKPTSLFSPSWSPIYWGYRLLAILFWFTLSWTLTAFMPGTVSRAASRLQLLSPRIAITGFCGAILITFGLPIGLRFLPVAVSAVVGLLTLILFISTYLFGRIVIHTITGRWIQRCLWAKENRSESMAILLGTIFWAVMLSLPYVWPFFIAGLIVLSLGLAFTSRCRIEWQREINSEQG
jgi:hypothetical protein